ncbi:MAG TPA: hypothetical protein VNG13_13330 [Mycobacteriales bacterium]|nr:hypothetical protein [Mycobacteriales bacterium]
MAVDLDESRFVDIVNRPHADRTIGVVHAYEPLDLSFVPAEKAAGLLRFSAPGDSPSCPHPVPVEAVHLDRLTIQVEVTWRNVDTPAA